MSQEKSARRCLYDILEVPRDADFETIKKAYKQQAKKWHPDKNLNNVVEAEQRFKEINEAYTTLSDKHERAWYDAHREQILRNIDNFDAPLNDDIDLWPYFSSYAYSTFDDSKPNNFYQVYNDLIEQIIKIDGISNKNNKQIPRFGNHESSHEFVSNFYEYWENFSTKRKFEHKTKYNLNDAANRRIRKLMQKENKKLIDESQKGWETTIIKLINFIKRRDPRVTKFEYEMKKQKLQEEEEERLQEQEIQKLMREELIEARKKELEFHRKMAEEHPEDYDTIENQYECVVCQKIFKSDKTYENHAKSKKHIKALQKLKEELQLEDELFLNPKNNNDHNNNNNNNNNDNNNNNNNNDDNDHNHNNNYNHNGNIDKNNDNDNNNNNNDNDNSNKNGNNDENNNK